MSLTIMFVSSNPNKYSMNVAVLISEGRVLFCFAGKLFLCFTEG